MVKEEQNKMFEEVPWCLAGSGTFSTSRSFDDNRIQEANRALEAYEAANKRD